MRIVDPQAATLTNIEVLAFLTENPPRRPPNPPPNSRNWVPSPDLRDHNTVVKEIHNYVQRLSPHILKYPLYVHEGLPRQAETTDQGAQVPPPPPPTEPTPLDHALRELITRLQPYGLTKGEVLMIVNLGVGLDGSATSGDQGAQAEDGGDVAMADGNGAGEEGLADEDYGALALLDTVIEEREERLSNEDVAQILKIIRESLGSGRKETQEVDGVQG
ncbi:hypothetical protein ANI_1_2882024 [Paecilomyces variotii No. 5]|uniref:DNA-directed RNA polymerase III subunit RPC9 n=1 Tax=Byssochlamys spectabilis (strain No. 5 / NBRC 109023) TaxID=1356009 RepID=V5FRL7_BYSSN|nr:hypothetical protein ANI_1_2882024 [Paecilomyces variotii No. 5]